MTSAGTGPPRADATPSWRSTTFAFYAVLAVYLVVTVALIGRYKYSLYPDATSYLSIAQAYARGQFWDAVNGYWSPLYCWMLAPLLAAGVDVLLAPKLLGLVIGAFTLAGVRRFARRMGLEDHAGNIVLVGLLPSLVCWSLTYVTSDFLLVAVLTWYLSEVAGWTPSSGARAGLTAGALAGTAYLAKQYALPFVAAHLAFSSALHFHGHPDRASRAVLLRWLVAAYVVLCAVSVPWIALMSAKYHHMTIAASGTYNWYLLSTGFNVGTRELAPPPFPGAASAWVDPTPYAQTAASRTRRRDTSATTDLEFGALTGAVGRAQIIATMLEKFSVLALPILAASVILAVRRAERRDVHRFGQLGLALGLFIGGYQVVTGWLVERLVWILAVLLAVLGGLVFQRFAAAVLLRPWQRLVGSALLVGSLWPLPMLRLAQTLEDGRELYETALRLQRAGVHGRLASLNRYADSLRVAFFTGSTYYGRIAPPASMETVLGELRLHRIEFLLIWAEDDPRQSTSLYDSLAERFPDALRGERKELSALDVRGLGR